MASLHLIWVFVFAHIIQISESSCVLDKIIQFSITSPVDESYYLYNAGTIYTNVDLIAPELAGQPSFPDITFCTTFYKNNIDIINEKEVIFNECKPPPIDFPSFDLVSYPHGYYTVKVELIDNEHPQKQSISDSVNFYVGRFMFKKAVLGLSAPSTFNKMPQQGKYAQQNKDIVVLAVKYGTLGDDASISVAINGKAVINIPLDDIFMIDDERTRQSITLISQKHASENSHNDAHVLTPRDHIRLSQHLALQAATGFASGCEGLFVKTSGVTSMCNDVNSVRSNWINVKMRIQETITLLYGDSINKDTAGDIIFDAIVFISGEGDARYIEGDEQTPLYHIKQVFRYLFFAINDDCQASGNSALIAWADYNEEPDDLKTVQPVDTHDSNVVLIEESVKSGGVSHDDIMSPKIPGLTVDATSYIRRKLRTLKENNLPFTICRPGLGWDTTLAHRFMQYPSDTIFEMEYHLMREHAGVSLIHSDHTSQTFDRKAYLDFWNEVYIDRCDAVAVFPGTAGRVKDYCHLGLKRRNVNDRYSENFQFNPTSTSNVAQFSLNRCDTFDGRMLSGATQLLNPDTWLSELKQLRVLIIHPFASTIKAQYEKHKYLIQVEGRVGGIFPHNVNALPIFKDLLVISPPIGNKEKRWHEALLDFIHKLDAFLSDKKELFDIALISGGAWGPLIQGIIHEKYNKSSIYMGGALQVQFGIWGGRYKSDPVFDDIAKNSTEWVWPLQEETEVLKEDLTLAFSDYATPT